MMKNNVLKFSYLLFFLIYENKAVDHNLAFPEDFLIGTASSAYQVEGAWNFSGKSENMWDNYTHAHPEQIQDRSNGDISCNSYFKYKEDIQLLKDIGFNHYRFSLSWSRILPTGYADNISESGVLFYHNILDELDRKGIIPFVTIYHFDHPQVLEESGGWLNESMAYVFADYARFVFKEFGNKVKYFSTINEPNIFCSKGYGEGTLAPGLQENGTSDYICAHNMLKAHALAYHIYDKEFRNKQKGQIGIISSCMNYYSKDKDDFKSKDTAFEFDCGWIANPIFSDDGDYPAVMKKLIKERSLLEGLNHSRLPTFSKEWINFMKGTSDYFGLLHYTSIIVKSFPAKEQINWPNDKGLLEMIDPNWHPTETPWLKVVPEGFGDLLRTIKRKYNNPPVYVLENGVPDSNGTNDSLRKDYLYSYMKEMLIAIHRDKCNVKAYTIWSFLDSFEWRSGYTNHYGLIHVNFNNKSRKRTPKQSVSWIKSVLSSRKLLPV